MLQQDPFFADAASRRASRTFPSFACTSSKGVGATWIRVSGELDLAAAPQLATALGDAQREPHLAVLDLRELTFLDCAGVHAIVDASTLARSESRHLLVVQAPDHVQRIFALSGTSESIDVLNLDPDEQPVQTSPSASRRSAIAP